MAKKPTQPSSNEEVEGLTPEASVQATHKAGGVEKEIKDETEVIGELQGFTQPVCVVNFSLGHTKNLGNYESLKTHISLSMPCYPTEVDMIADYCKEWVNDRMEKLQEELDEELNG